MRQYKAIKADMQLTIMALILDSWILSNLLRKAFYKNIFLLLMDQGHRLLSRPEAIHEHIRIPVRAIHPFYGKLDVCIATY